MDAVEAEDEALDADVAASLALDDAVLALAAAAALDSVAPLSCIRQYLPSYTNVRAAPATHLYSAAVREAPV